MQSSGPTDLQDLSLHFNKISRQFLCTLKFEKLASAFFFVWPPYGIIWYIPNKPAAQNLRYCHPWIQWLSSKQVPPRVGNAMGGEREPHPEAQHQMWVGKELLVQWDYFLQTMSQKSRFWVSELSFPCVCLVVQRKEVQARAVFYPLLGLGGAVNMCYRTLYIGTGEPTGRGAESVQP